MALNELFTDSVVFIGYRDRVGEPRLSGTGFVVGTRLADDRDKMRLDIVTAAHVLPPMAETFARLPQESGGVRDFQVQRWIQHQTEDIAATPFFWDENDRFRPVPIDHFIDVAPHSPQLGEEVFFGGLLGQVERMGETSTPMVRSGTVGALNQSGIPINLPTNPPETRRVRGHLIDARAFGGFSGSPCWVQFDRLDGRTENLGLPYPVRYTHLLGMVAGHFDLRQSIVLPTGDRGDVPVATGVVVVYPAETIRELLESDDLRELGEDLAGGA